MFFNFPALAIRLYDRCRTDMDTAILEKCIFYDVAHKKYNAVIGGMKLEIPCQGNPLSVSPQHIWASTPRNILHTELRKHNVPYGLLLTLCPPTVAEETTKALSYSGQPQCSSRNRV
jgi:hypothetical protein